jgi:hypothetical protein
MVRQLMPADKSANGSTLTIWAISVELAFTGDPDV